MEKVVRKSYFVNESITLSFSPLANLKVIQRPDK